MPTKSPEKMDPKRLDKKQCPEDTTFDRSRADRLRADFQATRRKELVARRLLGARALEGAKEGLLAQAKAMDNDRLNSSIKQAKEGIVKLRRSLKIAKDPKAVKAQISGLEERVRIFERVAREQYARAKEKEAARRVLEEQTKERTEKPAAVPNAAKTPVKPEPTRGTDKLYTQESVNRRLTEKRLELQKANSSEELLRLINETITEILKGDNASNIEAASRFLSEITFKLEGRINTEIDRFGSDRETLETLQKRYNAINGLLNRQSPYRGKVPALGRLELLKSKLESLFSEQAKIAKKPKEAVETEVPVERIGQAEIQIEIQKILIEIQKLVITSTTIKEDVARIVDSLAKMQKFFKEGEFEELLTKVVRLAVNNGNEYLYNRLTMRFGLQMVRIKKKLGEIVDRLKQNARAQDLFGKEIEELLKGLTEEGRAHTEEIRKDIEDLSTQLAGFRDATTQKLDRTIIPILDKLEKFFEPATFESFLSAVLKKAFAAERPELVKAIMDEFEKKYPDLKDLGSRLQAIEYFLKTQTINKADLTQIRQDLADILLEVRSTGKGIGHTLGKTIAKIDALEKYFKGPEYKKLIEDIVKPVIGQALKDNNLEIIKAMETSKILKTIIKKQNILERIMKGLKKENRADHDAIKAELEDILDSVQDNKTKIEDVAQRLEDLKDYFETDAYKTLITDIIKGTVPELATLLIAELDKRGLLTKDEAKKMTDEQTEELKKYFDEKVKKPEEEKKNAGWLNKWGWQTFGTGLMLVLILILAYFLLRGLVGAGKAADVGSKVVSITPVIGETAKAAGASESLLGSLGGINPLIIIIILVALFLLFPKK